METVRKLRTRFNLSAIKTKGLTLLIEHGPCCLLSAAAGFIGVSTFNHNPILELGFALGGAVAGEYLGHKYFAKNCHHGAGWKSTAKRYGLSLMFGLASWGVHQAVFHDHNHDEHDHHSQVIEQTDKVRLHDCSHGENPYQDKPFFGSPELKKQLELAHKKAHAHCHP